MRAAAAAPAAPAACGGREGAAGFVGGSGGNPYGSQRGWSTPLPLLGPAVSSLQRRLSFQPSYICPEPVLANARLLVQNDAKKTRVSALLVRATAAVRVNVHEPELRACPYMWHAREHQAPARW